MSKWCKTAPLGVNTKLMDGGSAEREKRGRKGDGCRGKQRKLCLTDRKSVGHVGKIEGGQMSSRGEGGLLVTWYQKQPAGWVGKAGSGRDQFRPVANSFAEPFSPPRFHHTNVSLIDYHYSVTSCHI